MCVVIESTNTCNEYRCQYVYESEEEEAVKANCQTYIHTKTLLYFDRSIHDVVSKILYYAICKVYLQYLFEMYRRGTFVIKVYFLLNFE